MTGLASAPAWPLRRARFLFREINDRGHDLPLASVTRDGGVEYRSDLDISVWNPADNVSTYKRVLPGDFVIGLRSFQSGIAYSPLEGLVSPAYTVLRPTSSDVFSGYFRHFFKSVIFISRLENIAQGIRQGRTIGTDDFYGLELPLPPIAAQEDIADYLDRGTRQINKLIRAKRLVIALLKERAREVRSMWYETLIDNFGAVPLRRKTLTLEQGWSPSCDNRPANPDEWGVLKTSAASSGVFVSTENKVLPGITGLDPRWIVKDGDLLIVRGSGSLSGVGQAAVAKVGNQRLLLSDLLYRLRLENTAPTFIAMTLQSPQVRQQIEGSVRSDVGQTLKIRAGDIGELLVPAVPYERQADAVSMLRPCLDCIFAALQKLELSVKLLQEHRQTLIAAAVTGQLDIPKAI